MLRIHIDSFYLLSYIMGKSLVLVFHKVDNESLFEKIIIALKKRYRLLSIQELETLFINKKGIKDVCHISFDDGDISFYNAIFPVLKKHNVPASLFLSPDIISSNKNYWFQEVQGYDEKIVKEILSTHLHIAREKINRIPFNIIFKSQPIHVIEKVMEIYRERTKCGFKASENISLVQLQEIMASGLVEVGAHTIRHPILKNENDTDSMYEITASIKGLEAITGKPVKYFAFPNGLHGLDFEEREMNCLRENNISMAFSTDIDTLSPENNLLSIPRMSFDRMGLHPSNPLIFLRLNMGKRWTIIKSLLRTSEKTIRVKVNQILSR